MSELCVPVNCNQMLSPCMGQLGHNKCVCVLKECDHHYSSICYLHHVAYETVNIPCI